MCKGFCKIFFDFFDFFLQNTTKSENSLFRPSIFRFFGRSTPIFSLAPPLSFSSCFFRFSSPFFSLPYKKLKSFSMEVCKTA